MPQRIRVVIAPARHRRHARAKEFLRLENNSSRFAQEGRSLAPQAGRRASTQATRVEPGLAEDERLTSGEKRALPPTP